MPFRLDLIKLKPITAAANITLEPMRALQPGPPHTYLGIAESLLAGIRILAGAPKSAPLPLAMLCAHAVECILKAYLSRSGDDTYVKKPKVRHNLNVLWSLAHQQGLAVSAAPPEWVACLSRLHESPYYLRYSTGVHGIVSPAPEPMASELVELIEQVRKQLQNE